MPPSHPQTNPSGRILKKTAPDPKKGKKADGKPADVPMHWVLTPLLASSDHNHLNQRFGNLSLFQARFPDPSYIQSGNNLYLAIPFNHASTSCIVNQVKEKAF